jgi:hypothetical protein
MDPRELFGAAAASFVDLVTAMPSPAAAPALWTAPALGVWDVRALTGHTTRALVTVASYLDEPRHATTELRDAPAYYRATGTTVTDPEEVAARGVAAGAALGADPASAVAVARDRAVAALDATTLEAPVTVVGGLGLPLGEYLRTRVLELVVHSDDLARATAEAGHAVAHQPPEEAVVASTVLLAEVAGRRGEGTVLLRALSGRVPLPADFTAL